jgi:hypothetical protein
MSRVDGECCVASCSSGTTTSARSSTLEAGRSGGCPVELDPSEADYFDLIVGLHPDEATRSVAGAALVRPAVLVPCCNFWSEEKLGREALIEAIEGYYEKHGVAFERIALGFKGPMNIGLVSEPPEKRPVSRWRR